MKKKFDMVLVWRIDRLGRSLKHLLQLIEEFKYNKVAFVSLSEGFDTGNPQGELFFHIAGAFAQFERRLIQERINAGLARAKAEGVVLGRRKGSKNKNPQKKSKQPSDSMPLSYSDLELEGEQTNGNR
jgi:DNA invertase Pin-like site-specific DNA recombinase